MADALFSLAGLGFPGLDAGQAVTRPAGAGTQATGAAWNGQEGAPETSFSQYLREALAGVEAAQRGAAVAGDRLASGQIQDLAQVVIASEKATLSLQLLVSVRNRALEAYQEIMRMPL